MSPKFIYHLFCFTRPLLDREQKDVSKNMKFEPNKNPIKNTNGGTHCDSFARKYLRKINDMN
jgi:queuine/archaeosine tRNA-ribosyltransferase